MYSERRVECTRINRKSVENVTISIIKLFFWRRNFRKWGGFFLHGFPLVFIDLIEWISKKGRNSPNWVYKSSKLVDSKKKLPRKLDYSFFIIQQKSLTQLGPVTNDGWCTGLPKGADEMYCDYFQKYQQHF